MWDQLKPWSAWDRDEEDKPLHVLVEEMFRIAIKFNDLIPYFERSNGELRRVGSTADYLGLGQGTSIIIEDGKRHSILIKQQIFDDWLNDRVLTDTFSDHDLPLRRNYQYMQAKALKNKLARQAVRIHQDASVASPESTNSSRRGKRPGKWSETLKSYLEAAVKTDNEDQSEGSGAFIEWLESARTGGTMSEKDLARAISEIYWPRCVQVTGVSIEEWYELAAVPTNPRSIRD